jgi:hypothetical protein
MTHGDPSTKFVPCTSLLTMELPRRRNFGFRSVLRLAAIWTVSFTLIKTLGWHAPENVHLLEVKTTDIVILVPLVSGQGNLEHPLMSTDAILPSLEPEEQKSVRINNKQQPWPVLYHSSVWSLSLRCVEFPVQYINPPTTLFSKAGIRSV